MVTFAGVDHVSFTVSDLDVSQRFYIGALDFVAVLDVGYGRILMHPGTGFTLSLMKHERARGGAFTELTTGLDHLGLSALSRSDLEDWERRFNELGVTYTPIRDMEFGYHLNFRDPDNIALELSAPNEHLLAANQAEPTPHARPPSGDGVSQSSHLPHSHSAANDVSSLGGAVDPAMFSPVSWPRFGLDTDWQRPGEHGYRHSAFPVRAGRSSAARWTHRAALFSLGVASSFARTPE